MDKPDRTCQTLDCGIPIARIRSWLEDDLGLVASARDTYLFIHDGQQCSVRLTQLEPRTFGIVAIERTNMELAGAPAAIDAYLHLFTLQFISAGG